MSGQTGAQYVIMETHYNNEESRAGISSLLVYSCNVCSIPSLLVMYKTDLSLRLRCTIRLIMRSHCAGKSTDQSLRFKSRSIVIKHVVVAVEVVSW